MSSLTVVGVLELVGLFVFAMSGALTAIQKGSMPSEF
ncbi:putative membrane protein YeiH [Micromonospora sp. A200]|nr:TRIC cation channel family protein [Micromonospora sp. A200]MDH6462905.1 putative membrane protein YeiH [Micromonospora sp. A200]